MIHDCNFLIGDYANLVDNNPDSEERVRVKVIGKLEIDDEMIYFIIGPSYAITEDMETSFRINDLPNDWSLGYVYADELEEIFTKSHLGVVT